MLRKRLQAAAPVLTAALLALALAGCGQGAPSSNAAEESPKAAGYGPAPELLAVQAAKGGRLELTGAAPAGVTVRIATPSGPVGFTTADKEGRWRLDIPAAGEPRLLGLSMSQGGRVVQAMGYLFLAPDAAAARLRAGGGSELIGGAGQGLAVETVDYDNQRASTLAGRAAPGEAVRVRVDGVERGESSADERGRFLIPLNQPLAPGAHDFDLQSPSGEMHTPVAIAAPAPLAGTPFVASQVAGGWRVDWLTPGGGEQTTLLLARPSPTQ